MKTMPQEGFRDAEQLGILLGIVLMEPKLQLGDRDGIKKISKNAAFVGV